MYKAKGSDCLLDLQEIRNTLEKHKAKLTSISDSL